MNSPGTYVLILYAAQPLPPITIGKLCDLSVTPGYYLYIGSALGPGGVRARVAHHCRTAHKLRWHIDYLRAHLELIEIWYTLDPEPREGEWVTHLQAMPGMTQPVPGFGASDSRHFSHLFHTGKRPTVELFRKMLHNDVSKTHVLVGNCQVFEK
jgi:Uri superfamily endonuclease